MKIYKTIPINRQVILVEYPDPNNGFTDYSKIENINKLVEARDAFIEYINTEVPPDVAGGVHLSAGKSIESDTYYTKGFVHINAYTYRKDGEVDKYAACCVSPGEVLVIKPYQKNFEIITTRTIEAAKLDYDCPEGESVETIKVVEMDFETNTSTIKTYGKE